jgi:TonB family protein
MKLPKLLSLARACFLICLASLAALAYQVAPQPNELPEVVAAAAPIYPPIALAAHATGEVIVEVKINSDGAVSSASAVKGHALLLHTSLAAARRWKFKADGVKSDTRTVRLTFIFQILDKEAPAEELTPLFLPPYAVKVTHSPGHLDID